MRRNKNRFHLHAVIPKCFLVLCAGAGVFWIVQHRPIAQDGTANDTESTPSTADAEEGLDEEIWLDLEFPPTGTQPPYVMGGGIAIVDAEELQRFQNSIRMIE